MFRYPNHEKAAISPPVPAVLWHKSLLIGNPARYRHRQLHKAKMTISAAGSGASRQTSYASREARYMAQIFSLEGIPVAVDRLPWHETAYLSSRPGARHRICSAGDQCLRVVVWAGSVVRSRTARWGLRRSRRWVLGGENVV